MSDFVIQWWQLMTWNGRHRASGPSWKSSSLALTSVTKRGSLPPNPRTTAGLLNSTKASSSECPVLFFCMNPQKRIKSVDCCFRVQLFGHWGGSWELRAAGVREGLLLRPGGPHRGHGRAAGEGHSQQGQRHLLDAAWQACAHGRDGPDGPADPLATQQRRRG